MSSGTGHLRATTRARTIPEGVLLAVVLMLVPAVAAGQPAILPEQPLLGSTLNADVLRDLPTGNSPFAVLETIQPESIGNRFWAGGLNAATAPQFGGFLNSWTQTQFRVGDIAITDPRAGGTPLLLPLLPLWARVTTGTGGMPVEDGAPALSMTLEPPRPGRRWVRAIEGSVSGPPLVAEGTSPVPAVDQVRHRQEASITVSGALTDRLGLVAAASWRGLSHLTAPDSGATRHRVASGFAHLVFAASPRDEVRALGWAQQAATAVSTDTAVHVQATWQRHDAAALDWRLFGGYTERRRTAPQSATLVVDSLETDPMSDLIDAGAGTDRRWAVGARVAPRRGRLPTVGVDLDGADVRVAASGIGRIDELVNGAPARVWTYGGGGGTDIRHLTTASVFVNEQLTAGRVTLDVGARVETLSGGANGAVRGIHWTTWLPRASLRWRIAETAGVTLIASYRRAGYQLPLDVLALGDPAAPFADVSVWNGTASGPRIARVGPGTGGDAAFAQIDPRVQRPTTDELLLALHARPLRGLQLELARVTKRERPLLEVVDTGLAASDFTTFQVPDPSFLPGSPVGAPQVTAYSRPPDGYGRDRYLLTNRAGDPARSWALQASVRVSTDRLTILAGANLTWAVGPAAAVGFLPTQNDQDVLGSRLFDPNTATWERGQLFQDRSHVVKIAGIYRLPGRVRVGAIARYQDGQPFARLVIAPTLTQGPTAVRSYANGGSAFTYTGTLDTRVQKAFTAAGSDVTVIVDVYNLTNLDNEVTEHVVTGPRFRTPTARQPPRTALVSARVAF